MTLQASRLPTNLTTSQHPVHRWFNFIAGFSPEFVASCIEHAPRVADGYLLDPFAGTGTALVEAQRAGLRSVGYEPHPFFAEMARAKLARDVEPRDVDEIAGIVEESIKTRLDPRSVWSEAPRTFLEKLLPPQSLEELAACTELAHDVPERIRPLFRLIVSRVLEEASFSSTDGIYKAPTTRKRAQAVPFALDHVCAMVQFDLAAAERAAPADIIEAPIDSDIEAGASLCVTSPPYLNNFDFAEMTRMELYFWRWAGNWGEITETVRSKLLVNTTTAPRRLKGGPFDFQSSLPPNLRLAAKRLYTDLAPACAGRSKDYHRLVFPYLAGLHAVIAQIRAAMVEGAPVHVVVADSAFYGIHVPLPEFVVLSLQDQGFKQVSVKHLRERGDRWILAKRKGAPGKLGEYWVSAFL